ncbi:hypothetical protein U4W44_22950 [Escherichia coli]|nr:hypothetical protein [Escherichia coli]
MDKNVEHVLVDAIENKQSLTVVYLGGSQPGTLRNISPISINGDKLRARCHSSGAVKVFNLGKIQLPSDSCAISMHYGDLEVKAYETMQSVNDNFHALYPEGRWGVDFNEHRFALFDFFKNGKRKKTAFMAIEFRERDEEKIITGVTIDIGISGTVISEKSRIPKTRPWVVVGPEHGEYSTYSTLDKAATAFFERLSLIASGLEDN